MRTSEREKLSTEGGGEVADGCTYRNVKSEDEAGKVGVLFDRMKPVWTNITGKHLTEETVSGSLGDHPQLQRRWCRTTITVLWASLTKFYSALLCSEGGIRRHVSDVEVLLYRLSSPFSHNSFCRDWTFNSVPLLSLGCGYFTARHKLLTSLHFNNALHCKSIMEVQNDVHRLGWSISRQWEVILWWP